MSSIESTPSFEWSMDVPCDFSGRCYVRSMCSFQMYEAGVLHCLDGPSIISGGKNLFYIAGIQILKEKFWLHPLVIQNKIKRIINENF